MDGLTNIIAKIHEQNELECKGILETAQHKAKDILDTAKSEAARVSAEISASCDHQVNVINSRALAGADAEYKRAILSKKSELIDSAIKSALESIKSSPTDVYFGYIEKLVLKNALEGDGTVFMSTADISRLPQDFEDRVNKALPESKRLVISKDALNIDGGFVIDYPEMRVDCTLESLVSDKLDEIRDELSRVLFA